MSQAGYIYLEDVAIGDVAFKAWGRTREEMFVEAARAMMNCMIKDLHEIDLHEIRLIHIYADAIDLLLFRFLQELLYYKDAERLLFARFIISIQEKNNGFELTGDVVGEFIDPRRHNLGVDVKAVTLHQFDVSRQLQVWNAFIILDI